MWRLKSYGLTGLAALLALVLASARIHAADAGDASDSDTDSGDTSDTQDSGSGDEGAPTVAASSEPGVPVPVGVPADGGRPSSKDLITLNYQNVDIPVLARLISELTGKNFVIDENVRGKVSIISPTRVTPEQAYSIFQSVLQLKGFTTVQAGPIIKIIPARDVRQSAALTQSQEPGLAEGDEYVTRMVRLRNTDATSLMSVVQPMISHDGLVAAFPQDNTLIITDSAYNVQRLLKIIGTLDIRGVQRNVAVIPLRLAFATDMAGQIDKIMSVREAALHGGAAPRPGVGVVAPAAQGAATTYSVVPDERTNSLIVLAGPLQMREIKDLVLKLDVHSPNEMYRLHVIHLKYAPAAQIVDTLNGLLGGGGNTGTLSPQTGRNSLGRNSGMQSTSFGSGFGGGYGGGGSGSQFGSAFGSGSFSSSGYGGLGGGGGFGAGGGGIRSGSTGTGTGTGATGTGSASTGSSGGRGTLFENPVSVTADPATNSLIISAAPQDYETLRRVIEQLDVPRVQVFVQAILVEVSLDHTKNIGVNYLASTSLGGNVLGVGNLNYGALQNALGNPLGLTGLGIGLASGSKCNVPTTALGGSTSTGTTGSSVTTVSVPCDLALLTALQSDVHTNVLSAPTLLTADNEEATIVVGQNVPFVGSASANSALSGQIFNSVDRQNVGITLDMVPQVASGDSVRLDVYEEVSNVVAGTANQSTNPLGPTTTIRSASTSVFVQNHRTAVIGGLISNETDTTRQGVPFISDIPVIGNLFTENDRENRKLNLIIFLTPHVIRTRDDLTALAIDQRQDFVKQLGRQEVNSMPASQFQQLYKPTFNAPISPQRDLQQMQMQQMPYNSSLPGSVSVPPVSSSGMRPTASYPPMSGVSSSSSLPPAPSSPVSYPPAAAAPSYPPATSAGSKPAGESMLSAPPSSASGGAN
ncbi:MAG TPA: type II secretion system secretin GspD [Candidatus Binataceae bacterium]|nr:type II secretion system secretin GspD [Candidatus Binataceae bacterium]